MDQRDGDDQVVKRGADVGCDIARGCREVLGEHHQLHDAHARKERGVLIEHDKLAGHGWYHAADGLRDDNESHGLEPVHAQRGWQPRAGPC